jgi:hypothetical protein
MPKTVVASVAKRLETFFSKFSQTATPAAVHSLTVHEVVAKLKSCDGAQLWNLGTSHAGKRSVVHELAEHWGKEEATAERLCKVLQTAKGCRVRFAETIRTSSPFLQQLLNVEKVMICASCPTFRQDAVSQVCMSTRPRIVIAFRQKDDAIDRWRVKVVQATVQAMETAQTSNAKIIFIDSERRSTATDEEWGMWLCAAPSWRSTRPTHKARSARWTLWAPSPVPGFRVTTMELLTSLPRVASK